MIPVGYMAKRVSAAPEWMRAVRVTDVYSLTDCVNDDFADYVDSWKHNGYWLFDQPEIITELARELSIDLTATTLFYYEAYEQEYTGDAWRAFEPWDPPGIHVVEPVAKRLEGFDVVTFWPKNSPQPLHSPLSCNGLAEDIPTNSHCLLETFDDAKSALERGAFKKGEPGPHRIFAVYSVEGCWPVATP